MIHKLWTTICLIVAFSTPSMACKIFDKNRVHVMTVEQDSDVPALGFQALVGPQTLIHNLDWNVLFTVKDSNGKYLGSAVEGTAFFDRKQVMGQDKPRFVGSAQIGDNEIFLYRYMEDNVLGYVKKDVGTLYGLNDTNSEAIGYAVSCSDKEAASGFFFYLYLIDTNYKHFTPL